MTSDLDLLIVGGGPAGMMAGLLFARAGCRVKVLEKHADFFRDFRGDTVHPSTMEILDQLGLLQKFLKRPHDEIDRAEIHLAGRDWAVGDISHLHTVAPYLAMMPQWEFLDFLRDQASVYPGFHLEMEAPVASFLEQAGVVTGVRLANGQAIEAKLTIAADGRDSIVRKTDMLPVETLGAPMDVLWFRIAKHRPREGALRFSADRGIIVVLIDRDTYWQCAFVIPKGKADELKAEGIDSIRSALHAAAPDLDLAELDDVSDLKLLSVALDRLTRWWRPGLLAIGDAAHAMSPIGGVGINLAVQDAVAAANILAGPLAAGQDVSPLLSKVQSKRMLPTRAIQRFQKLVQDRIVGRLLQPGKPIGRAPIIVRLLDRIPWLRRIPGRLIGLGIRRERVRSPAASGSP